MLDRIDRKPLARAAVLAALAMLVYGWTAGAARAPASAARARTSRPAVTFAAAGCPRFYGLIQQSMSGRVSGCLRLGALRPGPHTVVLLQVPNLSTKPSPAQLRKLQGAGDGHKIRPPNEPAVALSVSPESGRPGTVVTITGRLSTRLPRRQLYPNFCWDGCGDGLQYGGVSIRRTSARTFRARLVVPGAPWVEGGPVRVVAPVSGDYSIDVQCLVAGKGCDSNTPEGVAAFHLEAPSSPAWCTAPASCARLRVSPAAGMPGDVVKVTGFAPLVSVTGSDQPFVYQFEVLRGRPHGPEVDFTERNGGVSVTFGRGALDVQAALSFAGLRHTAPISEVSDGLPAIAANPLDPSTVAWCAGAAVDVSRSGMATGSPAGVTMSNPAGATTSIPTGSATPVLARLGFQVLGGAPAPCAGVALIDTAAGSLAGEVAAFAVALPVGGPPFYDVPLVTYDGGQTWTPPPVPPGATLGGFGGFRYDHEALELVFAATGRGGSKDFPVFDPDRPLAAISDSPGSWRSVPLGCPASGPCVTLGPFAPGNCAMNGVTQTVLRSSDGGRRWSRAALPDLVQACSQSELVATSARDALLVNSMSPYPLLRSTDGGFTWRDIGLPLAPHEQQSQGLGEGPGGITVLPDGGLLLTGGQGYSGGWELLRPGGRAWCRVRTPAPAVQHRPQLSPLTVIDGGLWWLSGSSAVSAVSAVTTINQTPVAEASC